MKKVIIALSTTAVALALSGMASAQIINHRHAGVTIGAGLYSPGGNFGITLRPFYQTSQTFNVGVLALFNTTESNTMLVPEGQVNFQTGTDFVPHILFGGGYDKDNSNHLTVEGGAGFDWKFSQHVAFTADARIFSPDANSMISGGLTFTFG